MKLQQHRIQRVRIGTRAWLVTANLEFDLTESEALSSTTLYRHDVIVDLAQGASPRSAEDDPLSGGFQCDHLIEYSSADDSLQHPGGGRRDPLPGADPGQLGPIERRPVCLLWQLQGPRPVLPLVAPAVAQREAAIPESEVWRVEVGGVQGLFRQPDGPAADNLAEVGQREIGRGLQLHFAFEVLGLRRHAPSIPISSEWQPAERADAADHPPTQPITPPIPLTSAPSSVTVARLAPRHEVSTPSTRVT